MGDVVKMARWRVDIIRKRAEHLGTVEAATEKEAIMAYRSALLRLAMGHEANAAHGKC